MTKDEENQLTMIESTTSLLDANADKLTLPALKTAAGELDGVLLKIMEKVKETMTATAGKAQTKANAEDALLNELMVVAKGLLAYGYKVGNQEIIEKAKVTESQLRHTRDTEFVAKARTIEELARENTAELANFGITAESLDSLKGKIDSFEKALGDRESSVARRKGARLSFYDYLDQAKGLLENVIDNLMEPFRKSDPQFYNEYMEARVVKDVGLRHREAPPPQPQPAQTK